MGSSSGSGTNGLYIVGDQGNPVWVSPTSAPSTAVSTGFITGPLISTGTSINIDQTATWSVPCSTGLGHHVSELIEYIDGVVVAYCDVCNQRIQLDRIPGGIHLLYLQLLIEKLISEGSVDHETLAQVAEMIIAVKKEREALDEAEQLIGIVMEMIDLRDPCVSAG